MDFIRLLEAIRRGNVNEIQELADVYSPTMLQATTPEGNTALHIAAQGFGPSESTVKLAEVCPVSVFTVTNARGQTPAHLAAVSGDLLAMDALIRKLEADVEQGGRDAVKQMVRIADINGDTALHLALRNKHEGVAAKLMDVDGLVLADLANARGESPLYLAALGSSSAVLERIIQLNPRSHGGPEGRNALHAAVAAIGEDIGECRKIVEDDAGNAERGRYKWSSSSPPCNSLISSDDGEVTCTK